MTPAPLLALLFAASLPLDVVFPPGSEARALDDRGGNRRPLAEAMAEHAKVHGPCRLRLEVVKAARRLDARCGDALVRSWVVNLGGEPLADKVRQGDSATPEGELFVCGKNEKSAFHLFLGLSYPMAEDAARGLPEGLVSEAQARAIREAERAKRCPPWNTKLGGAVGIHGHGGHTRDGAEITFSDWTLGCVAVSDPEIEELFAAVKIGTRVTIRREEAGTPAGIAPPARSP